ncbi:MAG: hypothetical protein EPGJADBJ_04474 [Saprospiraceae bacterium]|nr:hypothetical protein [Saprospiraceae bacterium]
MKELSEREMLLILIEKVDRLEHEVAANKASAERIAELEKQVIELRVKYQTWAAAIGFFASVSGGLISKLINF